MASMLSFLICVALVTAMNGTPTADTETSGCSASVRLMSRLIDKFRHLGIHPRLTHPYGEVKKASPWPSFVNMQSSTMS